MVIGLGLHRPMTAAELAPLARWAPLQSDPDDFVAFGSADAAGVPVPGTVTRALADRPKRVTIGTCELHQYAGVSGGHKGVVVGCGGRPTISALHRRRVVIDDGVRLGAMDGNPFRAAIDDLGEQLGVQLALNFAPGPDVWLAGPPSEVSAAGRALLDPWERVDRSWSRAVLRVPRSKGSSLYQASRAATYLGLSPRPPLVPGAVLVVEAACPEGLGAEAGFVAALQAAAPPWQALLTGPAPTGPGAQRAVMFALLARDYRLELAGVDDPAPFLAVGIHATRAPAGIDADTLLVERPFQRLPQRA